MSFKIILLSAIVLGITSGCVMISTVDDVKHENLSPPSTITVPPAPKQAHLKVGQSEKFTYWGHNITVNYTSSYPDQIVKLTLDGKEKNIEVELNASPRGIYWQEDNLSFALKPVVWEIRNNQRVPIYENTWNTTEIYLEIAVSNLN
jgi:hypothetical protein